MDLKNKNVFAIISRTSFIVFYYNSFQKKKIGFLGTGEMV